MDCALIFAGGFRRRNALPFFCQPTWMSSSVPSRATQACVQPISQLMIQWTIKGKELLEPLHTSVAIVNYEWLDWSGIEMWTPFIGFCEKNKVPAGFNSTGYQSAMSKDVRFHSVESQIRVIRAIAFAEIIFAVVIVISQVIKFYLRCLCCAKSCDDVELLFLTAFKFVFESKTVAIGASYEYATRSLTGVWTSWFFFMAAGLVLFWSSRCTFNG